MPLQLQSNRLMTNRPSIAVYGSKWVVPRKKTTCASIHRAHMFWCDVRDTKKITIKHRAHMSNVSSSLLKYRSIWYVLARYNEARLRIVPPMYSKYAKQKGSSLTEWKIRAPLCFHLDFGADVLFAPPPCRYYSPLSKATGIQEQPMGAYISSQEDAWKSALEF